MRPDSRRRWFLRAAALTCAGFLALVPQVIQAHHGWAGNSAKEFELTGTVTTPVSLAGPHATMKIKTADGQIWDRFSRSICACWGCGVACRLRRSPRQRRPWLSRGF